MFNKEELMSKDIAELAYIARSLNIDIENIQSPEHAIEQILALQEKEDTAEPAKRTRKRVIKKDTTDHVYSVKGTDGENLDTKSAKKKAKASTELFAAKPDVANPFPKHRGRKSKAELEYLAKMAAEMDNSNMIQSELPFTPADDTTNAPEAEEQTAITIAKTEQTENNAEIPQDTMMDEELPEHTEEKSTQDIPQENNDFPGDTIGEENDGYVDYDDNIHSYENIDDGDNGDQATDYPDEEGYHTSNYEDNQDIMPEPSDGMMEFVPEASYDNDGDSGYPGDMNIIAQLQAKMNSHNTEESEHGQIPDEDDYDGVWEEDPADGTDFIIVEDLPIEDMNATANLDIFDNPTNAPLVDSYMQKVNDEKKIEYNFNNIVKTIGLLEVMPENYGFLRSSDYNYLSSPDDVFVPMQQIRKLGLKTGDVVECMVCPPLNGDKYFTIQEILRINGRNPQDIRDRVPFEHLVPLFPDQRFNLCGNPRTTNISTRIVDLFSPIGKGQRALIVAQPKTGKTILMKDIANAIAASHPEAYLMMLLIDERPEEVTDMARTVNAEVIASTFDEPADRHVKIAGLVLEKAKRLVECGHDVVIFLDSITRLARAYNTVAPASGKVLTGGVDANALQKPKRFFGAARNIEDGGSLTIIATALIDTGSKMDEVIFEEFKGTGNMELQLDRSLSNKRIFPSVNLIASSTRRDDLLQDKATLDRMWVTRKFLSDMNPIEAMNIIHDKMKHTRDNEEFLLSINS